MKTVTLFNNENCEGGRFQPPSLRENRPRKHIVGVVSDLLGVPNSVLSAMAAVCQGRPELGVMCTFETTHMAKKAAVPQKPGYKLIFRPVITLKNGKKLHASAKGLKAWAIWVRDE